MTMEGIKEPAPLRDRMYETVYFEDGTQYKFGNTTIPKILNSKGKPIMGMTPGLIDPKKVIIVPPLMVNENKSTPQKENIYYLTTQKLIDRRQTALENNDMTELIKICEEIESRLTKQKASCKLTLKDKLIQYLRTLTN